MVYIYLFTCLHSGELLSCVRCCDIQLDVSCLVPILQTVNWSLHWNQNSRVPGIHSNWIVTWFMVKWVDAKHNLTNRHARTWAFCFSSCKANLNEWERDIWFFVFYILVDIPTSIEMSQSVCKIPQLLALNAVSVRILYYANIHRDNEPPILRLHLKDIWCLPRKRRSNHCLFLISISRFGTPGFELKISWFRSERINHWDAATSHSMNGEGDKVLFGPFNTDSE